MPVEKMFRIYTDATGNVPAHGRWHPDRALNLRYLDIQHRSGMGHLLGHIPPEAFTAVMRALVSADYDTPNWCEKCHLDGNDGCCRCEIACNE
jgi:hypothetical protein